MSGTPPGYTLEEVRGSLNDLRVSHESGRMEHCANYVTIRLVTLIEQFCRIAYRRRHLEYDWKQAPPPVTIQILVDVFRRFDPGLKHEECELKIRLFGNRNDKSADGKIRLKSDDEVRGLVRTVLKKQDPDVEEWIRLYTLSFQSVKSIKDRLGVSFTQEQHRDINELFGRRNTVVHTPSDRQVNESTFAMVESLFLLIDNEVRARVESPG